MVPQSTAHIAIVSERVLDRISLQHPMTCRCRLLILLKRTCPCHVFGSHQAISERENHS
ncbi:hypothetical protein BDB00DRAFT_843805 [Zychaea mexicana]|uniref:uncharacterized protein n=1 Tax=Zychaea mexicana TaxID=64656 RepID=UPI0022FF0CE0|nr:uncharacterized protein BDB00DRAFT_843805 [Zychaea mexicana]KAI9489303.1 hypothetical protein BDB00DRAFT_843805 [Zychaea mexicana]